MTRKTKERTKDKVQTPFAREFIEAIEGELALLAISGEAGGQDAQRLKALSIRVYEMNPVDAADLLKGLTRAVNFDAIERVMRIGLDMEDAPDLIGAADSAGNIIAYVVVRGTQDQPTFEDGAYSCCVLPGATLRLSPEQSRVVLIGDARVIQDEPSLATVARFTALAKTVEPIDAVAVKTR